MIDSIFIINSRINTNYRIINEYSKDRGNCYLLEFDNSIYQPILHQSNNNIQYNKTIQF